MKDINIYLICGKARSGKDTFGKKLYNKLSEKSKPCMMHITEPLYNYAKNYFGWDGNTDNKPREFLQTMGIDIIRDKMNKKNFLIDRLCEDIEILSNFYDSFIVTDIRLINEIECIRNRFSNVKVIHIKRNNYISDLTDKQKSHITEVELDNYKNFDYEFDILENENIDRYILEVMEER